MKIEKQIEEIKKEIEEIKKFDFEISFYDQIEKIRSSLADTPTNQKKPL